MTLLDPRLRARARGGSADALRALLRAERFRLGRDAGRVAANLAAHGGVVDERSPVWIGADLPPHGAPSVTLGSARGTLGPHSFGFLDNHRGIAALAAPLPVRPPQGSIALVCGRREALPDVGPLCAARGLGVSWIISAGDGDLEALLAFLAEDPGTSALLVAAPSLRPAALASLAGKPAVVLGGDPLLRAAVRRAGGVAADDLEDWLAHGALLGAGVARPARPVALVVGAGSAQATEALRAGGLPLPVSTIPDDDPDEVPAALAAATQEADLVLLIAGEPLALPGRPTVFVDAAHLDRLRALGAAIALRQATAEPSPQAPARPVPPQARAILDEAGDHLSDHDTKRLLKLHGARVSRQAPANSPTAAQRNGALVGLPVDVVAPEPGARETQRRARTVAELRRAAAVLLDEGVPYVLVREAFPEAPRARLAVRRDRTVGAYAVVGEERALLPLDRADATLLARATEAPPSAVAAVADLLTAVCACAQEHELALDLELFTGEEPAVIAASGRRATT